MCLLAYTVKPAFASPNVQNLVYEVYAGGIHAVKGTLDIDVSKDGRYSMVVDGKTRGLLGRLAPWEGRFESHGWTNRDSDTTYKVEKHQSTSVWREEHDIKEYLYKLDGRFKSLRITDKHSDRESRDVDAELTDGTTDVLTATMNMLRNFNETNQCVGEAEVFDGKRRFKQVFKHVDNVDLIASKYNIYEGPAAECIVEVVPVSGDWHKKPRGWMSIQEQGRDRGTMPTIWVAKLSDDQDAPAIPVKIRVKTSYGTLFMHLAEYKNAKTLLVAEKRMKNEE